MQPNVHSSTIFNSQYTEANQVPINRRMDKEDVEYIHTYTMDPAIKKNEILQFAATWMDLGGIMLCKIRQRMTNNVYHSYVESKK